MNKVFWSKFKEVLLSVTPIILIVLILHFTIAPLPPGTFGLFVGGSVLLILGMTVFMVGADIAMHPMGEMIGAQLTKSKKVILFVVFGFLIGFMVTIAEPDLQALAQQLPTIPNLALILSIAVGVGVFLIIGLLRVIFKVALSKLLFVCYGIVFLLAAFVSKDFLPVSFDSGGVTTGPITVPFILALGLGVSTVRDGKHSSEDSFGLVAIASVGPILAVMILGLFFGAKAGGYEPFVSPEVNTILDIIKAFIHEIPLYLKEISFALLPMAAIFLVFQFLFLKLKKKKLLKMGMGLLYTFIGLVLFLVGIKVGFMPAGKFLGAAIASLDYNYIIIPIGMVMGFCVVMAEPAVHVLNQEVVEVSGGTISKRSILMTLSLGVAASIGISMIRVLTGISIWYFLIPGYLISLALTFFVPKTFTGIAFDSGGVASGAMTATFLLPFAIGASEAVNGNILTDAFGLVAMVAMTPLIAIQLLGLIHSFKLKKNAAKAALTAGEKCVELPPNDSEAPSIELANE